MNPITIALLSGHDTPTVYYDTRGDNIKLSTVPTLTMVGYNNLDIPLTPSKENKPKKSLTINTNDKTYYATTYYNTENKNKEKTKNKNQKGKKTELPDEQRCCAITKNGNRCKLRRYTKKNSELCHIHYKSNADELNEPVEAKVNNSKTKTNRWYSWIINRLFSRK